MNKERIRKLLDRYPDSDMGELLEALLDEPKAVDVTPESFEYKLKSSKCVNSSHRARWAGGSCECSVNCKVEIEHQSSKWIYVIDCDEYLQLSKQGRLVFNINDNE